MSKVIVTGGAGFIGSHVAEACLKKGHEVWVMDDLSGGYVENVPKGCEFYPVDLASDNLALDRIFQHIQPGFVFHCAAYAAEGLSHHIKRYNYLNNVVGSAAVINACINCIGEWGKESFHRLVFTSSAAVYGYGHFDRTVNECEENVAPIDPYGLAKWTVEQELELSWQHFGLCYNIFRPHNVYGVRQNMADPYRNVVAIFMKKLLLKQPLPIFGNGEQTRCFTFIDDLIPALLSPLDPVTCGQQTYNIGSSIPTSINELADTLEAVFGYTVGREYLPERVEAMDVHLDHAKAQVKLGMSCATPLKVGLESMAEWARTQRLDKPHRKMNIEVDKNLPEAWRKL